MQQTIFLFASFSTCDFKSVEYVWCQTELTYKS